MITDIDKSSSDRSLPVPNRHDQLSSEGLMSKGTNSTNYITPASSQDSLDAGLNGQFTIVQVGTYTTTSTITIPNPGAATYGTYSSTIYSVAHGLPFIPALLAYEQNSSGQYTPMPYTNYASSASTGLWYTFSAYVDATYVYVSINGLVYGTGATFNPGFIFKWYLLQQTSN